MTPNNIQRKIDLSKYQDAFSKVIDDIIRDNIKYPHLGNKKEIAEYVGLEAPILSRLTKKNPGEPYHTKLTGVYLMPFIVKGVIMVKQLCNDGCNQEIDTKVREFWRRAKLQEAVNRIDELGLDPEKILNDKADEVENIRLSLSKKQ